MYNFTFKLHLLQQLVLYQKHEKKKKRWFNTPKLHLGYGEHCRGRLRINFDHLGIFVRIEISKHGRLYVLPPSEKRLHQAVSNRHSPPQHTTLATAVG